MIPFNFKNLLKNILSPKTIVASSFVMAITTSQIPSVFAYPLPGIVPTALPPEEVREMTKDAGTFINKFALNPLLYTGNPLTVYGSAIYAVVETYKESMKRAETKCYVLKGRDVQPFEEVLFIKDEFTPNGIRAIHPLTPDSVKQQLQCSSIKDWEVTSQVFPGEFR